MSLQFTITDKQISSIHNAMCYLYRLEDHISHNFKDGSEISQYVKETFKYLKPVRDELMGVKDMHDDEIRNLATGYAKEHNLKHTTWSIYNIKSFLDQSNVPVGAKLTTFYSKESVTVTSLSGADNGEPATWIELWKAVEELANKTEYVQGYVGFGDHRFIEKFVPRDDKENTFEVWLGS